MHTISEFDPKTERQGFLPTLSKLETPEGVSKLVCHYKGWNWARAIRDRQFNSPISQDLGGILLTTESHAKFYLQPNNVVFENSFENIIGYDFRDEEGLIDLESLDDPPSILLLWKDPKHSGSILPSMPIKFGSRNGRQVSLVPLGSLVEERQGSGQRRTRYAVLWELSQKQFWVVFDYNVNWGGGEFEYRSLQEPYYAVVKEEDGFSYRECTWHAGSEGLGFDEKWDVCVLDQLGDWEPETRFGRGILGQAIAKWKSRGDYYGPKSTDGSLRTFPTFNMDFEKEWTVIDTDNYLGYTRKVDRIYLGD